MGALWAIARNTVLMCMRRWSALVVPFFLLLSICIALFFIEGDNSILGRLQVTLTWLVGFMSALMMLLMGSSLVT